MELKFYVCKHCGNIVAYVKSSGVPVMCCGEKMTELVPGVSDGAKEKHVPVFEQKDDTVVVNIGEVAHPMLDNHYIEWVAIQTVQGNQRKVLKPGQEPKVCFKLCPGDEVVNVYAYCNLHGLYKASK
jgi:superoxide reductase